MINSLEKFIEEKVKEFALKFPSRAQRVDGLMLTYLNGHPTRIKKFYESSLHSLLAEIEKEVKRILPDGGGARAVSNPTDEDFAAEKTLKKVLDILHPSEPKEE